jgi:phosphatidylinositol glycan class K
MMKALFHTITILLVAASYRDCRSDDARSDTPPEAPPPQQQQHNHRPHNNYAIIVSTSRYWFNYRHHTNALLIYQYIKSYGNYTDDHIILMLADEYNVNPRNPMKNLIYNTATDSVRKDQQQQRRQQQDIPSSLYTHDIEIDYRGEDVNVENFVNALTGQQQQQQQHSILSPVLNTNADSHILVYMTGHGGDSFLKFQDNEEITSLQLAEVFQYMYQHGLYREVLFIADTCQAFTLGDTIISRHVPNVYVVGTSLRGESSYAHIAHPIIGVSVVEKYTHYMMEYVTSKQQQQQQHVSTLPSSLTLSQILIEPFNTSKQTNMLHAHIGMDDSTSMYRKLHTVPWDDFFVQQPSKSSLSSSFVPFRTSASSTSIYNSNNNNNNKKNNPTIRFIPMTMETLPRELVNHDSNVTATTTYDGSTSPVMDVPQCDINNNNNKNDRWETIPLEPDHPIFIVLVLTLMTLVVVGSRFY